ncbi:MAG: hypothetical protein P8H90_11465, partial [Tateyamaria sp.]|nr:hypothetical protein [Tateyamaria sp.]
MKILLFTAHLPVCLSASIPYLIFAHQRDQRSVNFLDRRPLRFRHQRHIALQLPRAEPFSGRHPVLPNRRPDGKKLAIGLRPHDLVLAESDITGGVRFSVKIKLTE